jgi:hypothetical protein
MVGKGCFYQDLVAAPTGAAGMAAIANPEGADLIVTRCMIVTTVAGAGATTVDAGIAANATTTSDTLIDGQTVNAVGLVDNIQNQAGNGLDAALWGANQYLTVQKVAGNALSEVGLEARIYVEYVAV